MGYKSRDKKKQREEAARRQEEARRQTEGQLILPIIYHELRKNWEVPGMFAEKSMDFLRENQTFRDVVDKWLDDRGLSEAVQIESNLYPNHGSWSVRRFVSDGGFVLYGPDKGSQQHSGLLYRQAQRSQELAKAQAESLLEEEKNKGKGLAESSSSSSNVDVELAKAQAESLLEEEKNKGKGLAESSSSSNVDVEQAIFRLTKGMEEQGKVIETLKEEVQTLKVENTTLKEEVQTLKAENTTLKEEVQTLKAENTTLKEGVQTLKADNTMLKEDNVKLKRRVSCTESTLASMKAVFLRKLLEKFCQESASMLRLANEVVEMQHWGGPTVAWWQEFIRDPHRIAILSRKSIELHAVALDSETLLMTQYDGERCIQREGSNAVHTVNEAPEVFATLVCQYSGAARRRMEKIYTVAFNGRVASDDAFVENECCRCPFHCLVQEPEMGGEPEEMGGEPGGEPGGEV